MGTSNQPADLLLLRNVLTSRSRGGGKIQLKMEGRCLFMSRIGCARCACPRSPISGAFAVLTLAEDTVAPMHRRTQERTLSCGVHGLTLFQIPRNLVAYSKSEPQSRVNSWKFNESYGFEAFMALAVGMLMKSLVLRCLRKEMGAARASIKSYGPRNTGRTVKNAQAG
jgi:hypothetical protein